MGTEEQPYYMGAVQVTAEALTDGAGRQGVITINADGALYELIVNQGEVVNTSVENVVAPMFDNKIYNLLGVEVDENYKGIVIKNGQKYIQ
jgi:pectate lyase